MSTQIPKKTYRGRDAAPSVLYGKREGASEDAYPILVTEEGNLVVSEGMPIPPHDQKVIDESDANNVTITYKLDGQTVATKTIVVSGTTTTISVT